MKKIFEMTKEEIAQYDTITCDGHGNIITTIVTLAEIDRKIVQSFKYDERDNLIAYMRNDGKTIRTETWTYNDINLPITYVDPDGKITYRTYDERGNCIKIEDSTGYIEESEYDENNICIHVKANNGFEWHK